MIRLPRCPLPAPGAPARGLRPGWSVIAPLLLGIACHSGEPRDRGTPASGARAIAAGETGADRSAAPAGPGERTPAPAGCHEADTRDGLFRLRWRVRGDPPAELPPRNEDFELEVWVFDQDRPVSDAQLTVRGWMPEHAHGMLRSPRALPQPDGSYRVEGMLLHMRGRWVLTFDVVAGTRADVAEFTLEL